MSDILAQISPQRSTQYSNIARTLAPVELSLSPTGQSLSSIETISFGNHEYLKFSICADAMDDSTLYELDNLSLTNSFFYYYENLGKQKGPFLKPIETSNRHSLPHDFLMTRRYKGKTNEMFTHFLCNVARYSSGFSQYNWRDLRVFDPLSGGGTTLFTALYLGAETAGIEKRSKDVQSTVSFLKQYTKEQGIPCKLKEERLKKSIKRYWFTIGTDQQKCLLINGDAVDSINLTSGLKKPHCIVTDLPYGIQHRGKITELIANALPGWLSILLPGGTIVMSWDSSRFSRKDMINLMKGIYPINILDGEIYEKMAHRVDRVIKERDVIVVRKEE